MTQTSFLERRIHALGPWSHNLELDGVQTAPDHSLGDYPRAKFLRFASALPADLSGKTVLDVGCNAGFYAFEMARRGAARVVAVDPDPRYLAQARLAAEVLGLAIELRELDVYQIASLGERFDLVMFMGVLGHLRHPLLALDRLYDHAVADRLLFQSMLRGAPTVPPVAPDYRFEERAIFDRPGHPALYFVEQRYAGDASSWWIPNCGGVEAMLRSAGFVIESRPEDEIYLCRRGPRRDVESAGHRGMPVIEAVMLWNEPNNKSHWDFLLDPDWSRFAHMTKLAAAAIRAEHSTLPRVLGGISPIDPGFITNLARRGVLEHVEAVAVHGFPLDWNHWRLDEWPAKLAEIHAVTKLPVWVSEVGASTFGADWVQEQALHRTVELLRGRAPRIHWYSLLDLPRAWPATSRHRQAEGSSYYRHFYMGVIREDGTAKPAAGALAEVTPEIGVCQWFHFEDHRLDDAVRWLKRMRVSYVRTGLSWSDYARPGREAWFDRQMRALEDFQVTVTFCFTPDDQGLEPHYTSPPRHPEAFAEFCAAMVRRYAR